MLYIYIKVNRQKFLYTILDKSFVAYTL